MNVAGIAIGLMVGAGLVLPQWHQVLVQEALAQTEPSAKAGVFVVKATTACFSDIVRVAGYLVPRRVAVVNVEADGYRITEVGPSEGEQIASGQILARLTRQGSEGGATAPAGGASVGAARPTPTSLTLRAPAAGLLMKSTARIREMASPQAEPLFQILVDNEIELEAQIPSIHIAKLKSNEIARVTIAGGAERVGRVRLVAPDIDQKTQLGKVRLAVGNDLLLRVGMFASATIDATRSCGVAIPRGAVESRVEGTSVRVVRGNIVEMRRVTVGLLSDDSAEIREGLSDGEVVVANAGSSLHDGDTINPKFPGEAGQPRAR
jgi:multidrug efflux pump subunit AcrA (membrane-fusion protein)